MAAKRQDPSQHPTTRSKGARGQQRASQAGFGDTRSQPTALPAETVPGADLPAVADLAPEVEVTTEGFPIVGIGASAGGLEALQELFGNMPGDSGMGFVVVTHQHPGHTGMLSALLGKSTQMPVIEARDGLSKTS